MVGADDIDLALLERLAQSRRFEARTLEIAKRHFVHGESAKRLAVEHGMAVQRIYAIRRMVLLAANEDALPAGWAEATLRGPKALVQKFSRLFEEELSASAGEAS